MEWETFALLYVERISRTTGVQFFSNSNFIFQELLRNQIIQRLETRLTGWLDRVPLDLDYLEFVCSQELVVLSAVSGQVEVHEIYDALFQVHQMVCTRNQETRVIVDHETGRVGRPRVIIDEEYTSQVLGMGLSVTAIAKMFGVCTKTLQRRMSEWGLSARAQYSTLNDEELDSLVSEIHATNPNAGYRMMLGLLRAQGHRVQWSRVRSSMHRVDTTSIVSRMTRLGCVVRRTYSVPSPKSLMHIDTNHKLIRYVN